MMQIRTLELGVERLTGVARQVVSLSQIDYRIPMLLPHLLLVAALVLSVYSQLIMKSRALVHSTGAHSSAGYLEYLIGMAADWRVLSAAGATFAAGACWLLALQR